ncbi:winged helix-turn-helix transcriptional regulator [Kineosporia babensis]|uniref:Helix-turn-helix transcriptional regulator n=1 Tax=Kineosporia babensis TaxID=499548 RepID=A0A9X1NCE0_9ACTN|nr:helix-turn-helix domain-containing protein [Kineosporia babensis]MCD5310458.1 helix-turn-helix transcriptional regulator [Kineosporia babensis]
MSELPPLTPIPADCDARAVLTHVTNKWGTLAMLALRGGPRRWNELLRGIDGVSEKMLAQNLKALVEDGFVIREQRPSMPPHVVYSLTPEGLEVAHLLAALAERVAAHVGESLPWELEGLLDPTVKMAQTS